jgi:ArsR family transcriptional regulator
MSAQVLSDPAAESRAAGVDASIESCEAVHLDADAVANLKCGLLSGRVAFRLAETFRVLGDPTRVRILDALSHRELCVCDLAEILSLTESAVSHQLRLLRSLHLVRPRRSGRMVFYALDDHHVTRLFAQGLEHVEEQK